MAFSRRPATSIMTEKNATPNAIIFIARTEHKRTTTTTTAAEPKKYRIFYTGVARPPPLPPKTQRTKRQTRAKNKTSNSPFICWRTARPPHARRFVYTNNNNKRNRSISIQKKIIKRKRRRTSERASERASAQSEKIWTKQPTTCKYSILLFIRFFIESK